MDASAERPPADESHIVDVELPLGFARTLCALPEPAAWVVVGAVAVMLRLGFAHRRTSDIDILATSQSEFIRTLILHGAVATSGVHHSVSYCGVAVETIDLLRFDEHSPKSDPLHLAVRHFLLRSRSWLTIAAEDDTPGNVPVASLAGMVALKAVSLETRRPRMLAKIAADVFDLTVLASSSPPALLADGFAEGDPFVTKGVAAILLRHFSPTSGSTAAPNRVRELLPRVTSDSFEAVEELARLLDFRGAGTP